jgi:hypothetical protein
MLWLIPLYCICAVSLIGRAMLSPPPLRFFGAAAFAALLGSEILAGIWISTVPSQPIRDTFALTNNLVEKGYPVIGIYMATREGAGLYAGTHHVFFAYQLEPASSSASESMPSLKVAENLAASSHKDIYAIVFFDRFLHRDKPELWNYLQQNYHPVQTLPGRLSPATIYLRNNAPTTQP